MKKILCVFICLLLLGGCGGKNSKEVKTEQLDFGGFRATVKTVVNDITVSADTVYKPYESLDFTFTSPKTVNGMQIICRDGEYTLTFNGLTFTLAGDKLPFSMLCKALESCLDNVRGAAPDSDGAYTYSYDGRLCKLFVNSETGCFERLNVDGADVLFFENFTFL